MKRLVVVLSSLLVLPAFAEVAPSYYDQEIEFSDVELNDVTDTEIVAEEASDSEVATKQATGRNAKVSGRATTARTAANRNPRTPSQRLNSTTRSRSISVRGTTTPVRTTSVSTRRTSTTPSVTSRGGTAARAATITTTAPLYNPTVSARGSSSPRASVAARGSALRAATISMGTTTTSAPSADEVVDTTTEMNTMKSLTEYCQAQYASCMDNYCNILDDNQGRCTCSKNISNYEKTEAALASANESLQDVARSIQYIGLSADQISTLFTETEAELTMKDSKDSSAIRNSLDKVKRMIVDVKSGSASASEGNSMDFDFNGLLSFDMDNSVFDMSAFMSSSTNTNSISNQRGESLYKTATARCKASVLNSCTAQGVDAAVVTNSYDLEIDKSCLAYERSLNDANTQMSQTVANAKEVLKKARLMVAQNKNSYDLRGCVSALESCMQDDYVCGDGYSSCLDPTGQYIVNGSVVIGSMPGNNTESTTSTYSHDNLFNTWNVSKTNSKNPWKTTDSNDQDYITLSEYVENTVTADAAQKVSEYMSAYLQNKIGWHDSSANKDYGMCMSVLNKCQNYTYNSKTGKYNPQNEVIKQFLSRALVQIKMSQDELLSSYAEDCISDVSSCLSSNNYDSSNPENTKSRTAINSCYGQIKTCLSVNGNVFGTVSSAQLKDWVTGNYANVETFTSNDDISWVCNQKDEEECPTVAGYCDTGSSRTRMTGVCTWDSNTHSCKRANNATCTQSNN